MTGSVCQNFFETAFATLTTALESCSALPGALPGAFATLATALPSGHAQIPTDA
jgi:hypothetical protein